MSDFKGDNKVDLDGCDLLDVDGCHLLPMLLPGSDSFFELFVDAPNPSGIVGGKLSENINLKDYSALCFRHFGRGLMLLIKKDYRMDCNDGIKVIEVLLEEMIRAKESGERVATVLDFLNEE